jgi:cyclic pyranopterin phosphate synthase
MNDRLGRTIDYLRISVTDRCNLRCFYCMPPEGIKAKPKDEILRLEEVLKLVEIALQVGISKFRLTGGEPLMRKGIVPLVAALNKLPGVKDIAITTNGVMLSQLGKQLRGAGVRRLNISLDTLDPNKYRQITHGGDFDQVWQGIGDALRIGFFPVKINTVALRGVNEDEWVDFARLTMERPLDVRFIELMPVGPSWEMAGNDFASYYDVLERIETGVGKLIPVETMIGNGPAHYYQLPGAQGKIGFIHAMSNHFCASCNRLRLTADGKLRPCLHDRREIDLRQPLRQKVSDSELQELFEQAISIKPSEHHQTMGTSSINVYPAGRAMAQIGG